MNKYISQADLLGKLKKREKYLKLDLDRASELMMDDVVEKITARIVENCHVRKIVASMAVTEGTEDAPEGLIVCHKCGVSFPDITVTSAAGYHWQLREVLHFCPNCGGAE